MVFIVYDCNEEGKHHGGKRIVPTLENLAAYINQIETSHSCICTDSSDNFVLSTFAGFIDRCISQEIYEKIVPLLISYRFDSNIDVPDVEYLD